MTEPANNARRSSRIEDTYLRIFKGTVVLLMTLALLAVVALLPYAAMEFFQTPKPATPAQPAPVKAISMDDLKQLLQEEERKRLEQEKRAKEQGAGAAASVPASQATLVLKYINESNNLLACVDDFRKHAEMSVVQGTQAQMLEQLNDLRTMIERLAADQTRGDEWVNAMSAFVCKLLRDPAVGQLRKEGKVGQVFYRSIRFHADIWTRHANEREQFNQREANRVRGEEAAEEARVAAGKAKAMMALTGAGSAFAAFMFMALYLIFARIERNLAGIEGDLAAGARITV